MIKNKTIRVLPVWILSTSFPPFTKFHLKDTIKCLQCQYPNESTERKTRLNLEQIRSPFRRVFSFSHFWALRWYLSAHLPQRAPIIPLLPDSCPLPEAEEYTARIPACHPRCRFVHRSFLFSVGFEFGTQLPERLW